MYLKPVICVVDEARHHYTASSDAGCLV